MITCMYACEFIDPFHVDGLGHTALHFACMFGELETTKVLANTVEEK